MFPGIVTDVGEVRSAEQRGDLRLQIATSYDLDTVDLGASISCSGVCLTVVDKGPGWFGVITLAGFAAAATAAAGPGLALRRLQPRGPALRLAATAAGVSAGVMAVAAIAIVIAVTSLDLWARQFAGYHHAMVSGIYLALVVATATVTTVSATRGTRAALAQRSAP